jgi:hypothetical protein
MSARLCIWVSTLTLVGTAISAQAEPLIAFATSIYGNGDMHSWPDAIGTNLSGLAAADFTCSARAAAAGLPKPGSYMAWLSDRDNDAYCRLFGLDGKKADNCGQTTLPTHAGPWVRTDQSPFAASIDRALNLGEVYSSLNVDEFGNAFYIHALSFTATDFDGTFNTEMEEDGDCEGWTSGVLDIFGPFPTLGSNLASTEDWTYDGSGVSCDGTRRLMCMQRGWGEPLSGHAHFGRREAFVSSAFVSGALGGLSGADAQCRAWAQAAGLYRPDSFKALLATTSPAIGVADRLEVDGEWYRRDGLLFAHNKAELVSGAVTRPLNVTENGEYVGDSVAVTGSRQDGSPFVSFDCQGWTSTNGITSGSLPNEIAFAPSGGHDWLSAAELSCAGIVSPMDWPLRLYCLSDADVLFHDGMDESRPDL